MADVNARIEGKLLEYPSEVADLVRLALQLSEQGASESAVAEQIEGKVRDIVRRRRNER